ncbi:Septum site-determining protein MinC [bacterium HR39]|nr:Septum site-determining protein MinC [bacterium HR39]
MQADSPAVRNGAGLPFQLRGSVHTLVTLRLVEPEDPQLVPRLIEKIAFAPDFYRDAPVVIDVGPVAARPPIDLEAFCSALRAHRLVPVGVQNASPAWLEAARRAGLAIFPEGRDAATPRPRPQPAPVRRGAAMLVDRPVRGGEQVVATDGDLVVTAPVGHGAEVAAVGHVHIYGPLRGRAFAGIEGDASAMIFCERLHAELLSIAGVYVVAEEIDPDLAGRRVAVRLADGRLVIEPLERGS